MRDIENNDIYRSSVLLMKLSIFIEDFTLCLPRPKV